MKTLRFAIGLLLMGTGHWFASGDACAAEGQRNGTAVKRPPSSPLRQPPKWIGVKTEPIPDLVRSHLPKLTPGQGVMVQSVAKESPGAVSGLERSDIVVRADGQPVASPQEFQEILNRRNFGTQVRLDLIQKGIPKTAYCIVLEDMDADGAAAAAAHERNPFRGLKGDKVTIQFSCPDAEGNMQTISATKLDQLGQRAQQDDEFRVKLQRMFDGLQQNPQGVTIVIRPSQEPPAATTNP
ncbi:MAG: PDZ domain-containing protein [Verrucomicrobia bacterium]|nr:PDZ domain-containing protein [Verrucomicrobiota bacterium]